MTAVISAARTDNPLLDFTGLPRFASIKPAHIAAAVDELIAAARECLAKVLDAKTPATWDAFVAPLEQANDRLNRAWGAVGHLHGVLDSPALRDAYNANQPKLVQFGTELEQNTALFAKYKLLAAAPEFQRLDTAQRRVIETSIRDFRLSGAELPQDKKDRLAAIHEETAKLSTRFSENVLDATNAFVLYVEDRTELAGVPEDVLEGFAGAAARDGQGSAERPVYKVTLQMPAYLPVMQYCSNRALRERLYKASATRASELGEAKLDNSRNMQQLLELRAESAKLLGFASFAELSIATKMAKSPQQVLDFLNDLGTKALPFARKDIAELREFARTALGMNEPQAWDLPFISERLREKRYSFSDQEVKQYFPEPKVLAGMFRVVETIYGLHIVADEAEVWDPHVRFFRILDREGAVVGQFYLDLYARETKRGGAWMDEALARRRDSGRLQTPVAYLVCNFPSPVGDKPALFNHDDVITLFHEFGHGLHHMLSRVDYSQVSGIRGVEWDAVELPSQFMENFCWEWEVLRHMTSHVDTGATLPRPLFDRMVAAKNFQSGMQTVRQLEFSLFDMHLHHDFDPSGIAAGKKSVLQLLDEIRVKVAVVQPPAYSRFPHSFGHIFSGGYSAGYYSYKWAEVLSADAYAMFEEAAKTSGQLLDPRVGARFREEILAVGGSRPAIDSFRGFRGREPTVDALLRHSGMVAA